MLNLNFLMRKDIVKKLTLFLNVLFILFLSGCFLNLDKKFTHTGNKNLREANLKSSDLIKTWDKVWVDYIWRFENGKVFDTSIKEIAQKNGIYNPNRPYWPISFVVWDWKMIPWFEKAVMWKKVGDKITVKIPPSEAYWNCNPSLRKWLDEKIFDEAGLKPKVWQTYNFWWVFWKVLSISWNKVFVDFNSPMCWKTLIFDIFIRKKNITDNN